MHKLTHQVDNAVDGQNLAPVLTADFTADVTELPRFTDALSISIYIFDSSDRKKEKKRNEGNSPDHRSRGVLDPGQIFHSVRFSI